MKALKNDNDLLDFRHRLQDEFDLRRASQPDYSLRAFARSLGIGASALSDMMKGKRTITAKSILRIGIQLGLSQDELDSYVPRVIPRDNQKGIEIPPYELADIQTASTVSSWQGGAFFLLLKLAVFRPDIDWVARVLGIHKKDAENIFENLKKAQLIKVDENGQWVDLTGNGNISLDNVLAEEFATNCIRETFALAKEAYDRNERSKTCYGVVTLTVDKRDIPEIKACIGEFQRALAKRFQKKTQDEIYRLQTSFFPLTDTSEKD